MNNEQKKESAKFKLYEELVKVYPDKNIEANHILNSFTIDIFIITDKIIINIDNPITYTKDEFELEMEKLKYLESKGYNVLRVETTEIQNNVREVINEISLNLKHEKHSNGKPLS
jgi:very-short-patch-repair endonuclease